MKTFGKAALAAGALVLAAMPASMAQAATLVIDVTGWQAEGDFGAIGNTLNSYSIGAGSTVTGLAYDLTIEAFDPSWLSEATLGITDSAGIGVFVSPSFDDEPGVASFAESFTLADFGLEFSVGADGLLQIEFFDTFADAVSPNALLQSGQLTITYDEIAAVPEPASWALMIGGFGLVGGMMRRRAKPSVSVTYA